MEKKNIDKLSNCKIKDQFCVRYLDGTEEEKRHLRNLGFVPSSLINIVNINSDNMIVQVFDSRKAINKEISDHIYGVILQKDINSSLKKIKKKKNSLL